METRSRIAWATWPEAPQGRWQHSVSSQNTAIDDIHTHTKPSKTERQSNSPQGCLANSVGGCPSRSHLREALHGWTCSLQGLHKPPTLAPAPRRPGTEASTRTRAIQLRDCAAPPPSAGKFLVHSGKAAATEWARTIQQEVAHWLYLSASSASAGSVPFGTPGRLTWQQETGPLNPTNPTPWTLNPKL